MRPKYIVGIGIILVFIAFAGLKLKQSFTPYVSLQEAKRTGGVVQVKGTRIPGSERYDYEKKVFIFEMKDTTGEVFKVVYHGVKPSNFEQAMEVVAIGAYRNGVFEANQLLIKCPSKYQAEESKGVQS
ncbi:MAG: cytochrome c maturation protein CcmE [Calditrichaeota bacterium]|nr:cytochrome c maturation protein CcmE [Calditrichota bacterium]